jgi:hypothetical protein
MWSAEEKGEEERSGSVAVLGAEDGVKGAGRAASVRLGFSVLQVTDTRRPAFVGICRPMAGLGSSAAPLGAFGVVVISHQPSDWGIQDRTTLAFAGCAGIDCG